MSVFYLVRHAHANWTPDENRPLSAEGRASAEGVADLLAPYPIQAIYASPARRAYQTIAPLAARLDLPVRAELALRERALSGAPVRDFEEAVRRTWLDPSYAHPGGEPNSTAQRRGVAVVERLRARHPRVHVVLSSHGTLMALLLQHFDPRIDFAFWEALTMPDVYMLDLASDSDVRIQRLWS